MARAASATVPGMTIARAAGTEELVTRFEGAVVAGSPLIIGPDDVVVLVRDGAAIRVIGPGQYQVPAEFAGPAILAYFVRTSPCPVKFGGPVSTPGGRRAVFGEATLQVTDPASAATQLGDQPTSASSWLAPRLVRAAGNALERGTDDPSRLSEAIRQDLFASYGLTIVRVTVSAR
jgi:hypothetical protein